MGWFRKRHRFKQSPLSLSVPLDGCDSVIGLQELQRRKDGDLLAKALNLSGTYGSTGKPSHRNRGGPSIWNASLEDAQKKPLPWLDFLWGSDWTSYSLCEGLSHLGQRAEENLLHWLPNYLRIFIGLVLSFMVLRPWSILGVAVLALVALWGPILEIHNTEQSLPPKQQRHLTFRQYFWEGLHRRSAQIQGLAQRVQQQQEAQQQEGSGQQQASSQQSGSGQEEVARSWGFMACTFVTFFTGIPAIVTRAGLYSGLLILGHSTLRQSPSEFASAQRNLGRTGSLPHSGVPFPEVLGFRNSDNPDPRRLLKESWSSIAAIASAAGIYVWHAAQVKCLNFLLYFRK